MTGRARDRDVLLLMSGVVVGVLAANLLSAAVPGLDVALARAPILVLVLVAGTALVLAGALRRPRR
ncbi:MAG: hypothetical protein M3432_07520 [Chloroflexota bacterium]|nr:hypothetical protein [Chloroflexota bacterium]